MLARKAAERATAAAGIDGFFVVSCSARTIIYKGFCLPEDLAAFYARSARPGLHQRDRALPPALQHQHAADLGDGPAVPLPRPQRRDQHGSGQPQLDGGAHAGACSTPTASRGDELQPVVSLTGSDSLSLDNVVELLYHGGRSLPHALMMLVPEPWEQLPDMDPERRAFYDFHAGLIEQWDGPAALGFTDGVLAGATLDRNGLRPLRYAITSDGLLDRRLRGRHGRGRSGDGRREGPARSRPDDRGRYRARHRAAQRRDQGTRSPARAPYARVAGRRARVDARPRTIELCRRRPPVDEPDRRCSAPSATPPKMPA